METLILDCLFVSVLLVVLGFFGVVFIFILFYFYYVCLVGFFWGAVVVVDGFFVWFYNTLSSDTYFNCTIFMCRIPTRTYAKNTHKRTKVFGHI